MKILIADKLDTDSLKNLKAEGFQLIETRGLALESLPAVASEVTLLVVRSTLVPAAVIAALPDLKLIIRAGAGTDNIDMGAAASRGIQVANCPGKNADAVAEMALGLLLAADRNIVEGTLALRQGQWKKGALSQSRGLKGRTLGIIGMGAVGRALARKAQGLEMKIIAYSRSLSNDEAKASGIELIADMMDLPKTADAISVHVSLTAETRGCLNSTFFNAMKKGSILVNTSRGEVVDRPALMEAIRKQGIRVALDVFAGEPKGAEAPFEDQELAALIVGTPHLAASTEQAAEAVGAEVVRIASVFRDTGIAPNSVKGK